MPVSESPKQMEGREGLRGIGNLFTSSTTSSHSRGTTPPTSFSLSPFVQPILLRAKSLQSCPALCDPMDYSPPGSSVHGIFQARILEWIAISSSRGSSRPRDQTRVSCGSCIIGRFFTAEPSRKPFNISALLPSAEVQVHFMSVWWHKMSIGLRETWIGITLFL